jgi:hypothetical protein
MKLATHADAARLLETALARLDRDGWSHGKSSGPNGERCLLRAIVDEVFLDTCWPANSVSLAESVLRAANPELIANRVDGIAKFNDAPGRTFDDVRGAIRRGIDWAHRAAREEEL